MSGCYIVKSHVSLQGEQDHICKLRNEQSSSNIRENRFIDQKQTKQNKTSKISMPIKRNCLFLDMNMKF
jgi:hypothetical protein